MNGVLKKLLIIVLALAAMAAAGWFGRKAYKRVTERRLVAQATHYLEQGDKRNASLCLQRALQLNPFNPESSRLMGDMLESAGVSAALSWRVRTAQLEPGNATNRFTWAETALRFKEYRSAAEALQGVPEPDKETSAYHQLAGTLGWNTGHFDEAEKHYVEALRLAPADGANVLNLNTLRLASTNRQIAMAARTALEQATTNGTYRVAAFQRLMMDAVNRKNLADALKYSTTMVQDPSTTFIQKLDHMHLLLETTNSDYASWRKLLDQEARHSPEQAFAFGRWMATVEGPTNALRWLRSLPEEVQTNQPIPLLVCDCQIAMKDWRGIQALIQSQNWGEAEYYRFALESLAARSLGQTTAAEGSWRKAMRGAEHRLDRMSRLASVTALWGLQRERMELLSRIVSEFPREKWATDQLAGELYALGKTKDLQALYEKLHSADPANLRVKNNLASLEMLCKTDLADAHRMAKEAYDASTGDPFCATTYAYSLFLQNRNDEAREILGKIKPEYLQVPSIAAYYSVIQFSTGHGDLAAEPLKHASQARLLPEETEMLRSATAGKL